MAFRLTFISYFQSGKTHMNIVLIGTGNVASVLGRLMVQKGHRIVRVVGRNQSHAAALAAQLGADSHAPADGLAADADIYIIAWSDNALAPGHLPFRLPGKIVVHTAGSVPMEVLKNISDKVGILYPLQSLRKEMEQIPEIPFLTDAGDEESFAVIAGFARTLSDRVVRAGDVERLKLHAAAVIVNNFTNHLYRLAEDFCLKEGVDFSILQPLILETASRIREISPSLLQTGPAARNDLSTIDRHLELLSAHPGLRNIYRQLSESIASQK